MFFAAFAAVATHAEPYFERDYSLIDPAAVMGFIDATEGIGLNIHSFMVLKDGKVAAEAIWAPYKNGELTSLYSLTKPMVSLAAGFAIQEGKISLDDPVIKYFPDDVPEFPQEYAAQIRFRDLLSMESGHAVDEFYLNAPEGVSVARHFFTQEIKHRPGTFFKYHYASDMAAKTIARAVGMSLEDYVKEKVFTPLGITEYTWERDKDGDTTGGSGLALKLEDIAKIGQFCLQQGEWNGEQLLTKDWFAAATANQADVPWATQDWKNYGFHFWPDSYGNFRGDGAGGQFMIIMRDRNAVVIITECVYPIPTQTVYDLAYLTLGAGVNGNYSVRNAVSGEELAERIAALKVPERASLERDSAIGESVAGVSEEGKEMRFSFTDNSVTVHVDGESVLFPLDSWNYTELADSEPGSTFRADFWARAAWTAPRELTLFTYANPMENTLRCIFGDGEFTFIMPRNTTVYKIEQ